MSTRLSPRCGRERPAGTFTPRSPRAQAIRIIAKRSSDAFYATPLRSELDSRGITRLVVTGAESDKCIDSTARRALSLDYDVTLAADAHTTASGNGVLSAEQIVAHHNATLADLPHPKHEITITPSREITF